MMTQSNEASVVEAPSLTPFREPKQNRSRASFEKVFTAARNLLAERGYDGFTLADVVKVSGVSVGSIYGRVDGKDDLLRLVQARLLEEMAVKEDELLACSTWNDMMLQEMLPALIDRCAEHWRAYSPWLRAFMMRAAADEIIGQTGRAAASRFASAFETLLLSKRSEIRHPDPERAAHACFITAYSACTRYLGLGSSLESAGEGDWEELKAELTVMTCYYMQFAEVKMPRSRYRSAD